MIQRVAQQGKNKGNPFWGCSTYPTCSATVNIDTTVANPVLPKTTNPGVATKFSPLYATPITPKHDVFFFQTEAIPFILLSRLAISEDGLHTNGNNKFRIDVSGTKSINDSDERFISSLALRLLNRGNRTINSRKVDQNILERFGEVSTKGFQYKSFVWPYSSSDLAFPFDSPLEKTFIETILCKALPSDWPSHIMTQVWISTLLNDDTQSFLGQRADILVSYPGFDMIIEIDGEEHLSHKEKDDLRDKALSGRGYKVVRITNEEVRFQPENAVKKLKDLVTGKITDIQPSSFDKVILAHHIVHQVQIAICKAIEQGFLRFDDMVEISLESSYFSEDDVIFLGQLALEDLSDIINHFGTLFGLKSKLFIKISTSPEAMKISFGISTGSSRSIVIRDIHYRENTLCEIGSFDDTRQINPDEGSLKYFLDYIFRFQSFNEGQYDTIVRMLQRRDSIVLLPTGSGKSVIYQLSAFLVPGVTFVISPIVSLMDDQIENLAMRGIDNAIPLYASIDKSVVRTKLDNMKNNNFVLVYLSPERLQSKEFRDTVRAMLITNRVFAVAIDEAHCVSEWGHDFRTAYLNIGRNSREVFKKEGLSPVIVSLTGTASTAVLKDIQREMQVDDYDAIVTPKTFDRSELHFNIYETPSEGKISMLSEIIKKKIPSELQTNLLTLLQGTEDPNCGIVFCPHLNGDFGITKVAEELERNLQIPVGMYSGDAPKNFGKGDWEEYKKTTASKFKRNQIRLLAATKAFGMGIDKPNIRYTVHFGIPSSIESYYQEAGRAGRDKHKAECIILFSNDNSKQNDKLLDMNTPLSYVVSYVDSVKFEQNDDISRMLYFHANAFEGIDNEVAHIREVIDAIFAKSILEIDKNIRITWKNGDKNQAEKAIHRLVLLGVVEDYTINYSSYEFDLKLTDFDQDTVVDHYCIYVKGYNEGRVEKEREKILLYSNDSLKQFVTEAARVLIEFVYDTIERGRRRGLREMVQMSKAASKSSERDKVIRTRIIRYFESTYSLEINEVLEGRDLGFSKIKEMMDGTENEVGEKTGGIRSANEAAGVRGQVSHYLESTPDHPGLLFLRSLSEFYSKDHNKEAALEDFRAGLNFAQTRYSTKYESLYDFILYFCYKIYVRDPSEYPDVVDITAKHISNPDFIDQLINEKKLPNDMRDYPLLRSVVKSMENIRQLVIERKE